MKCKWEPCLLLGNDTEWCCFCGRIRNATSDQRECRGRLKLRELEKRTEALAND